MFSNYNLLPKIIVPVIATVLIWALSENVFEHTQEIIDCD